MLSDRLMECLICPICGGAPLSLMVDEADGDLIVEADLSCPDCKRRYPVRQDIAVMMPPDLGANLACANERWEGWGGAMHRFLRWREAAWGDPVEAAERRENARQMHERFVQFYDLPGVSTDLLDVGCGTGHIADLLPDSVRYIGIDPLPAGSAPGGEVPAEIPRPYRQVSLLQGVGESLPFCDESFDAILMMGTLDHVRSPEEVLAEASRVLRPGGTLGVLLGLTRIDENRGVGGVFRALVQSLKGQQSLDARETHLHTFSSADEIASLLSAHFEVRETLEDSNRVFLRATVAADTL